MVSGHPSPAASSTGGRLAPLLFVHHLVGFDFLAEALHLPQRRIFFFEVLTEQLRHFGVLHFARHVDQRLIFADLVAFGLDGGANVKDIEDVFFRVLTIRLAALI